MSISGLLNATFSQPDTVQNSFSERRTALRQLGEDLQSGDLEAARQDFVTLTSKPQTTQSAALDTALKSAKNDPLVQALKSLKEALDKGDIESAKQAYQQLQQELPSRHGHGHHHRSDLNATGSVEIAQLTMLEVQTASNDDPTTATAVTPEDTAPVVSGDAAPETPTPSTPAPEPAPTDSLTQAFQALGHALQSHDLNEAVNAFGDVFKAIQNQLTPGTSTSSTPAPSSASTTSLWMVRIDVVSVAYQFGSQSGESDFNKLKASL